ncbi:MAG TPA: zinc ribbon domain-containing protein [Pyrinomonadaceae bacterium]|nr:zinc ribbon domain-containing protein [Pyrinomonadaceae bacterium]
MNIQTCHNCRQTNPPGQPFCSNCGLPLNPQPNNFGQPNFQNQPAMNQPPPFDPQNYGQQPPPFNQPPNNFVAPMPQANKKSPIRIIVAVFLLFGGLAAICGGIAKFSTGVKKTGGQTTSAPVAVKSSAAAKIQGKWREPDGTVTIFGSNGRYTESFGSETSSGTYEFPSELILRVKPDDEKTYADLSFIITETMLTLTDNKGKQIVYTRIN